MGARQRNVGGNVSGEEISVIVCVYDLARWEQIRACLASLREQTHRPASVVVVVDGCPALAAALRESAHDVSIVELPENRGLSVARNAGIEQIKTPWVAFLDDDAVAEPTWLERLDEARRATGALGVGGWVEPLYDGEVPNWFPPQLLWTVGCSHQGLPTRRSIVRNVFGGCALMSTVALRQLGGYDPSLGRRGDSAEGGEEADLCIRISRLDPTASRLGAGSLTSETTFVRSVGPDVVRLVSHGRITQALVLLAGVIAAGLGYVRAQPRSATGPASVTT